MSYTLYINGNIIELSDSNPIAQTKQVNDISRLDNRQTNFTHKFIAPLTSNNVRAMGKAYLVGNQSNIPYQKNEANLFDSESNVCFIYKGWAVINQTTNKGYEINIYDGIIDFYRKIENKTLTEMGISGLNHAKSIANIVNSWNNTLPYFYAITDYNGKNKFVTTGGQNVEVNTDYQVPSARVSYIWDRIFAFAGFTYSGTFFNTEKFQNLFMTFPKPVPSLVPNKVLVYAGIYSEKFSIVIGYEGNVQVSRRAYLLTLPRENFNTPYASVTNYGSTTNVTGGFVYNNNEINILQNGLYTIDAYSPFADFLYFRRNSSGVTLESGSAVSASDATGDYKTFLFNCLAGDKIAFIVQNPEFIGDFDWKLNRIDGYVANFEEAFVDFKVTDFVNEIMQRAALTAFKDKYTNHIEFIGINEILASNTIIDWSDKFVMKESETYKIGNYAKKNNLKYKYNEDNESHNDGSILINDANLKDEYDVIRSNIYSPELKNVNMIGMAVKTFKIWDKNLKDDSSLEYKELSGRYYFLRYKKIVTSLIIASESLNQQQSVTEVPIASFSSLSFKEIIDDNYKSMISILDKGKIINALVNLNTIDVEKFDFKKLIYIKQLGSYYLVNKINNFIKNKLTKCELLEVDYKKTTLIIEPSNPTYVKIDSFIIDGCNVIVTYSTDAPINKPINLTCNVNTFLNPNFENNPLYYYDDVIYANGTSNTISFSLEGGANYIMYLEILNVNGGNLISNVINFQNDAICSIVSPTTLEITSVALVTTSQVFETFNINFTTNAILPRKIYVRFYKDPATIFGGWSAYSNKLITPNPATTNLIENGVYRLGGDVLKFQMKIGNKESNEFTL